MFIYSTILLDKHLPRLLHANYSTIFITSTFITTCVDVFCNFFNMHIYLDCYMFMYSTILLLFYLPWLHHVHEFCNFLTCTSIFITTCSCIPQFYYTYLVTCMYLACHTHECNFVNHRDITHRITGHTILRILY